MYNDNPMNNYHKSRQTYSVNLRRTWSLRSEKKKNPSEYTYMIKKKIDKKKIILIIKTTRDEENQNKSRKRFLFCQTARVWEEYLK